LTPVKKDAVRRHFDAIAGEYDRWKERSSCYYAELARIYREFIPPGAAVLELGCGTGTILAGLSPRRGVGVDLSARMVQIAAARHPDLTFLVADAEDFDPGETFDFVIVPDVVEHLTDVAAMFRSARKACRPDSRVIVTSVNPLWAPVLHLAERLRLKMPEGDHRWLSVKALVRSAESAGLACERAAGRLLVPARVPLVAAALNAAAARLPILGPLCLTQVLVLRPR